MIMITIYTDGSSCSEQVNGGYGIVVIKDSIITYKTGYGVGSANRMEMLAVVEGIKLIKTKERIKLYTDSDYVRKSILKIAYQNPIKTDLEETLWKLGEVRDFDIICYTHMQLEEPEYHKVAHKLAKLAMKNKVNIHYETSIHIPLKKIMNIVK